MAPPQRNGNIMEEMTVEDMIAALEQTGTAVLVCGGTEQHGYHLPLSTDYVPAYEIAKEASRRTRCLLLPPLCYSHSGGKLAGTTNISPDTTTRVITDIALSLVEQGVRNIVLFCSHCGSKHLDAAKEAGYRIMEQAPGTRVAFAPILSLSKTWLEHLGGRGEHAGRGETSLMLYVRPDLVRDERPYDTEQTPKPEPGPFVIEDFVLKERPKGIRKREARHKYGVPDGSASEATAEFGNVLFDEIAETLAEIVHSLERAQQG